MCPTSGSYTFLIISCRTESANSSLGISDLYLVKKIPFCCLNQGSCLQPPMVTIAPTHSDSVSSTTTSQQLDAKPHACEAETSFSKWQMLRCPFSTSGRDVSSPFRSLHLPKPQQGWNGDAVNQQEKISAAGGAKEGKIKPTLPPSLACCVPAPPAASVHCVSGWK